MSEILTKRAEAVGALTFAARAFPQSRHSGTAIATLVAFPPFNYRGMQAVSASIPHPVALSLYPSTMLSK
ncbi:MAG: hypothetical protein C0494_17250 [Sphingobium sp.]|nr:hypothetical protein [Sphingobium sp.]